MNKHFYRFVIIVKNILKLFFPIKVYGPRELPVKKSILVGNHISGWDPIMYYMVNKQHFTFLYKSEFTKNAILRKAFTALDFIPVKRGEVDMNATKMCLRTLKDDKILALFPEGTRNPQVDCLQPLKTGAALYAIKAQAPLRAFYIWDKARVFRKNYIIVGEEFDLSQFYGKPVTKEILNEATEIIRQQLDSLRVQLNEINAAKGVKRRKRTLKEQRKIDAYNNKQKNLAKALAEKKCAEESNNDE